MRAARTERRGPTARRNGSDEDLNVLDMVCSHVPAKPGRVPPVGLDRNDVTCHPHGPRQEQSVKADVCTDVQNGRTFPANAPDRPLLLELITAQPATVIGSSNTPVEPPVWTSQYWQHGAFGHSREWHAQHAA